MAQAIGVFRVVGGFDTILVDIPADMTDQLRRGGTCPDSEEILRSPGYDLGRKNGWTSRERDIPNSQRNINDENLQTESAGKLM